MLGMEKFKAWIKKKGLTQQEVATMLGFDRATVNQWLMGRQGVSDAGKLAIVKLTKGKVRLDDLIRL